MRPFVLDFLVPLVRGGILHVGRPLGPRAVERLGRSLAAEARLVAGREVSSTLSVLVASRQATASRFLSDVEPPSLDETSLRLGAALHDLLALGHPEIAGRGLDKRQERIAAAALTLASLGPPGTAADAVNRHSLLAR